MADTYTSLGRALQIEQYTRPSSWGPELNAALAKLDGMWRCIEVAVAGNVTLTVENAITDQASAFVLILSGAGGFTVTAPALAKPYFVINNCAADVTLTPLGGTGAAIRAGTAGLWYCDGTDGFVVDPTLDKIKTAAADVSLGGNKITGLGAGVASTDAVTKSQLDTIAGSATAAAASASAAAASETNAANSATAADASADDAAASEAVATTKASEASASAVAAAASEVLASDAADDTASDRAQTEADAIATAADRVQTGLDAAATAADRVQTGLDRTAASNSADAAAQSAADAAQFDPSSYYDKTTSDARYATAAQGTKADTAVQTGLAFWLAATL